MATLDQLEEVGAVLKQWEDKSDDEGFDPIPYLTRLAEIIEGETEQYLKLDPDPFDDRHPCRTHPTCALGHSLKVLFKKETFMTKLVHDYLSVSPNEGVNTAACRLFVDILPGLETSVVYQETEGLILRLFDWAENSPEPLQSYALGLLGASMELPDIASKFREKNFRMVGVMLTRLKNLQDEFLRPFAQFSKIKPTNALTTPTPMKRKRNNSASAPNDTVKAKRSKFDKTIDEDDFLGISEVPAEVEDCSSSSSWAELESNIIGTWRVHPLTLPMRQIFTLRYLSPLGEYQEMLSYAFEQNAIQLILNYLDIHKTKDSRLTFEALKYLSALLCHKKFAFEFIRCNGLQKMLQIPRPSVSATGVSLSLYYIAYSEDTMEKVCQMPKSVLTGLTNYAMWLLECSHTSGRNHALMFFGVVYPFKVMLDLFDSSDGLRRVLNVITTQPDFRNDDKISEEDKLQTRQVIRHVCCNLKRYFEAHLSFMADKLKRSRGEGDGPVSNISSSKALKHDSEALRELNNALLEHLPLWTRWHPVDKFIKLGGLQILMQAIQLASDWNYSGRAETVRCALEILSVCCLVPRVQLLLTERYNLGNSTANYGMFVILSAAEGELMPDSDVQRAALMVIGNCVCGPINRTGSTSTPNSGTFAVPKIPFRKYRSSEELLQRMWECVRVNNGILILTRLLLVKTPITDADGIRAFACWCLSGLARYQQICQVLEQLPLMRNGLIHILMREPILQEKRHYHILFQKYAMEILRLVYGQQIGVDYAMSMVALHKSELISQTKIQYNENQLLELICEHLRSKGLDTTVKALIKEAGITPLPPPGSSSTSNSTALTPINTRKGKATWRWNFKTKQPARKVTLDSIVKEYLANQHSLCNSPMVICPTFDLLVPHKCPASQPTRSTTVNFASRFGKPLWGTGTPHDTKLIYSKFKPFRTIRAEQDQFSSCAFSSCHQWVIVGTSQGQVKLFNNSTANEDGTYACHDSEIYHVQPNKKGNLLLTSSVWRRPLSGLWKMEGLFDKVIEFEREEYVEFSKHAQDKVIGTNIDHAFIYDIETTKKIYTLEPKISNQYIKNRATFDPTDDLVLSDGVLWDCRAGTEIHKFDKLNENINGVFHPNGLEIISNSEVWDVRTFRLLQTVKALDQCYITFTSDGNVLYGIKADRETSDGFRTSDTSFVTLDASDYSQIATIELKKAITCLASSPNDLQIALVECHANDSALSDSCVRYYDVGRSKDVEEGDEEEDDVQSHDSEEDNEDNDDDDDDDDNEDLDVDRLLDELLPEDEEAFDFGEDSQDSNEDQDGEQSDDEEEEEDGNGDSDDDDDAGVIQFEVVESSDDSDYEPPPPPRH